MKQQINLYKHLPVESRFQLTQKSVFYLYGIFFILLMLSFAYSYLGLHRLNKQLALSTQALVIEKEKLANLSRRYPMVDPKNLAGTVQQLQQQLNQRFKLMSLLSEEKGFSTYLMGLSKAILPTVWLNQISIMTTEPRIELKGFSLKAIDVQLFLNNLNTIAHFNNITLDVQNVTKITDEKNSAYLSFIASNKTAGKP